MRGFCVGVCDSGELLLLHKGLLDVNLDDGRRMCWGGGIGEGFVMGMGWDERVTLE